MLALFYLYQHKMANGKKSFILYCDQRGVWDKLSNEQAGALIKHIFSYVNDENPEAGDFITEIAFEPIKQSLKRDLKKYEKYIAKQKVNGAKGGRPKKATTTQLTQPFISEPKKADNVNVNANVNANVNVKETTKKSERVYFKNQKLNDIFKKWLKMRHELKARPLAATSIEQLQMKMNYNSQEDNIAMVEQSLQNSWLKLVPVEKKQYKKGEPEKVKYTPPPEMVRSMQNLATNIGNTQSKK